MLVAGFTIVFGAGVILVWNVAVTSSARLTASTEGSGVFIAGTIDLVRSDQAVGLLFDADGLRPGEVVSSCVRIDYDGSLPGDIRLFASRSGGTGLAEHIELRLWVRTTGSCASAGSASPSPAGRTRFTGRLNELWESHPDYAEGLQLVAAAPDGAELILDAEAELVGGEAASGLTTEFMVVVEARP